MDTIIRPLDNTLGILSTNNYLSGGLTAALAVYTILMVPRLSTRTLAVFSHPITKVVLIALVLLLSRYSIMVAVALAVAFIVTLNTSTGSYIPIHLPRTDYEDQDTHQNRMLLQRHDSRHMKDAVDYTDDDGPLPLEVDSHHPPSHFHENQVAAVLNANGLYQGPQGLQDPQGFEGVIIGDEYGTPDSQL